jgi:hypothetical protein
MWIITDEPILFNTDTGRAFTLDQTDTRGPDVYMGSLLVFQSDTSAEAIDFIYGLAALLGAASVPMPPVEPDDKPDPF